ncbi:MAG: hypothetical protein ACREPX_13485, partial [Rhodanobacteraceae bacterium]
MNRVGHSRPAVLPTGETGMSTTGSAFVGVRLRPLAACLALALSADVFGSSLDADRAASKNHTFDTVPRAGALAADISALRAAFA